MKRVIELDDSAINNTVQTYKVIDIYKVINESAHANDDLIDLIKINLTKMVILSLIALLMYHFTY